MVPVNEGDVFDFEEADIVVAGGGEDSSQTAIAGDLVERREAIHCEKRRSGLPSPCAAPTNCLGGGSSPQTETRSRASVCSLPRPPAEGRMIGNVVVDSKWGDLVGFENHSGRTVLDVGQAPLGKVRRGYGNNDKTS